MKQKITKDIKNFWKSLNIKEKNQFLLLSLAYRDSISKNSNGKSGKFVELPKLKKTYNSNIFTYMSPWEENNHISFEFINHFNPILKFNQKYILSSNVGSIRAYDHLIESWCKFFDSYQIFKKEK